MKVIQRIAYVRMPSVWQTALAPLHRTWRWLRQYRPIDARPSFATHPARLEVHFTLTHETGNIAAPTRRAARRTV